jgi:hypothetical protein
VITAIAQPGRSNQSRCEAIQTRAMTGGSASGRNSNTWTIRRSENSAIVRASRRNSFDFSLEPAERDSPVTTLLEDCDDFRVLLTDGKFVASAGFDLRNDGAAVLSERWLDGARSAYDERSTIELSLSWEE